ncbi:MAG: glycosyltransferase [Deltaproteobacteria bacterium]|nr:glycosyltransferase [Deltaproteobacteria bacterium]
MISFVPIDETKRIRLDDYALDPQFSTVVADLRSEFDPLRARIGNRRVFMVNSTARGGGVAEMLPQLVLLLRELGLDVEWVTLQTDDRAFFHLTKRLHNLIHDDRRASPILSAEDARLYESVNKENADSLRPHLRPDDILVVHDPQPLPLAVQLRAELGLRFLWRCHIGFDRHTDATRSAWRFLRPYVERCDHALFSAPEYIPSFLAGRASISHPAIDPMSHKNRELAVHKMVGILCNAGLQPAYGPIPTPDFEDQAKVLGLDGEFGPAGELGLLFRPMVLQVSRWDRLKGWQGLLDGFLRLKQQVRENTVPVPRERNQRRLELARLVLAGPDPSSIQDDPEGIAVLDELCDACAHLDPRDREDVVVLSLPMTSRKDNGLIVNVLQRCASVVVQNSLREGFGLTVTEAMWKGQAVLGTTACGIRQQIRDGIDGVLTTDPECPDEIAQHLRALLVNPARRHRMGRFARRHVYEDLLIFRQVARYLRALARVVSEGRHPTA